MVIIVDKKSSNTPDEIKTSAKPLERIEVRVIPVAVGPVADPKELEKTTGNKENILEVPKDENSNTLGQKIMDKILKRKAIVLVCAGRGWGEHVP